MIISFFCYFIIYKKWNGAQSLCHETALSHCPSQIAMHILSTYIASDFLLVVMQFKVQQYICQCHGIKLVEALEMPLYCTVSWVAYRARYTDQGLSHKCYVVWLQAIYANSWTALGWKLCYHWKKAQNTCIIMLPWEEWYVRQKLH